MKIKFNKKTMMWECIDNLYGQVIDHFSTLKDAMIFANRNS
jgi:hypothetical protein